MKAQGQEKGKKYTETMSVPRGKRESWKIDLNFLLLVENRLKKMFITSVGAGRRSGENIHQNVQIGQV